MKRVKKGNLVYYQSSRLLDIGVSHGFFTRLGGVSAEPFNSLNVGMHVGDNPENVEQNRRIIYRELGIEEDQLVYAGKLGHGTDWTFDAAPGTYNDVDVVIATKNNKPLGLSVADCVPIIVAHRNPDFLAVIHAGWRGTVEQVTYKTLEMLTSRFSVDPNSVVAAVGQAIGVDNYQVGTEVVGAASKLADAASVLHTNDDGSFFDLQKANLIQLRQAGLKEIDVLDIDTYTSPEFYSYRKEDGTTGRNGVFALMQASN